MKYMPLGGAFALPLLLLSAPDWPPKAKPKTSPKPWRRHRFHCRRNRRHRQRMAGSTDNVVTSVDRLGGDVAQRANVNYAWELVGRLPGVMVTNFNQGAVSGKFSFRGFNGEGEINAVKLLIDGIPSNSNDGNMPYIDQVFPLDIAGIEVVRGTSDPRYGLHAIAGSANIDDPDRRHLCRCAGLGGQLCHL